MAAIAGAMAASNPDGTWQRVSNAGLPQTGAR
jgi:hypothetical protein